MPVTTPNNPPDPALIIKNSASPNTQSFINNFLASSQTAFTSDHSTYVAGPLQNNIAGPGTLFVNPADATALANALPEAIPWMSAYTSIILHELGHAYYATRSNSAYTSDPAKRVEWCYEREALASLYVFNYMTERGITDGGLVVPGPGKPLDLYATLLSAVTGKTPGSLAYENAVIAAAKAKFAASPKYKALCQAWANGGGLPPAYYPPPPPPGGGGGSGGGGGGAGTAKIPGGYWQPVPENSSD